MSYRNQAGADGYRTLISFPAFTWHPRFTSRKGTFYAGLEVSLVDWFAPLTELAIRQSAPHYNRDEAVALELVHPRIDVMFGLPIVSEHLGLSVGGAWRTSAPFVGKPGETRENATTTDVTYLTWWSGDPRVKDNPFAFFEFSLGAHYLF